MKRLMVTGVLLAGLSAQATSLKQLLEAASGNNVERQISLEQRKKAATDLRAAWGGLFPSLTVQGGWTHNQYPTEITLAPNAPKVVITPEDQLDGVARVELPLIDTSRWFRISAAGAADESAEQRDQLTRDNVIRQVSTTYFSYAAALGVRESAKRSLGVAEAQLKLQDIRFKAGAVTELEFLRAQAEFQRNKQTMTDTEVQVANLQRALRTLTNLTVGDEALLPSDNVQTEGSLEELEGKINDVPAVRAAASDVRAAESLTTLSQTLLVPQVTANFTERITNATAFTGKSNSYTAGIGLLWRLDAPTFFNMGSQGSSRQIARLAEERQRRNSRDQVQSDFQRLKSAIEKVSASRAQVDAAQRASKVATDRYNAGAATQIDVIQAERDLFGAEVNQIQARTELASSHVSLRLSAGLPVRAE